MVVQVPTQRNATAENLGDENLPQPHTPERAPADVQAYNRNESVHNQDREPCPVSKYLSQYAHRIPSLNVTLFLKRWTPQKVKSKCKKLIKGYNKV